MKAKTTKRRETTSDLVLDEVIRSQDRLIALLIERRAEIDKKIAIAQRHRNEWINGAQADLHDLVGGGARVQARTPRGENEAKVRAFFKAHGGGKFSLKEISAGTALSIATIRTLLGRKAEKLELIQFADKRWGHRPTAEKKSTEP